MHKYPFILFNGKLSQLFVFLFDVYSLSLHILHNPLFLQELIWHALPRVIVIGRLAVNPLVSVAIIFTCVIFP